MSKKISHCCVLCDGKPLQPAVTKPVTNLGRIVKSMATVCAVLCHKSSSLHCYGPHLAAASFDIRTSECTRTSEWTRIDSAVKHTSEQLYSETIKVLGPRAAVNRDLNTATNWIDTRCNFSTGAAAQACKDRCIYASWC